mmetsp:Transcript_19283/g.38107  ORF Transcript_19283/g.38107 Transcript_19283/m.38107 type:complete len:101 (-) Transcript_19283:357-659(-)
MVIVERDGIIGVITADDGTSRRKLGTGSVTGREFYQTAFVKGFSELSSPVATATATAATDIAIANYAILVNAELFNKRCLCRCLSCKRIASASEMDITLI